MDPNTQTPDLQAATGITPPMPLSGPSIIQALGSIQGPSPGLAAGSGMLNALGGGPPGANPYLQQHGQAQQGAMQQIQQVRLAQQADQQQQMMLAQLQQRAAAMRERQHQSLLSISQDLLKHESPEARSVGARGVKQFLKITGQEIPGFDDLLGAVTNRKADTAELNEITKLIYRGFPDDVIKLRYPNTDPKTLSALRLTADHPDARRIAGLKTRDEERKEHADMVVAEAKAIEAANPELGGDAKFSQSVRMLHLQQNNGLDYAKGTAESRNKAMKTAEVERENAEIRVARAKAQDLESRLAIAAAQGQNQMNAIAARLQGQQSKPLTSAEMARMQKVAGQYTKADDLIGSLDKLDIFIDRMDKQGALPSGPGMGPQIAAKFKRQILMRGSDDVFNFQQLWAPISIGQIDRGMFDEKGVRAISAFAAQLDAVDNMPPAKAMKAYSKTVRELLLRKMGGDIKMLETLGERPEVLDVAKDIYAKHRPEDPAARARMAPKPGPLNPTKQADFRYNPATGKLEPVQ